MDEQRRSKRVSREFPIDQFMVCGPEHPSSFDKDEFIAALGRDISAGGIGCECGPPLEPLTHVFVMFKIPQEGGRAIKAEGFVAHSRRVGGRTFFGVSFLGLGREERSALELFVETAG